MKFIKRLLLIILVVLVLISSFIIYNGYSMYKSAIKEVSLEKKVENIKNDVNFVSINDVPKYYSDAIIAVEDHRFKEHGAIDIISIGRAIVSNVQAKELNEGGSTITQQVAKNIVFSQEKSWMRKVGEIFAAYDLEKNYTKKEIFELYVNTAYFGDGYYGIYDASYGYYSKSPKDLNLDESSMLAGVPNAPSVYAPTVNPDLAKKRQYHVLNTMLEYGYITKDEALSIK